MFVGWLIGLTFPTSPFERLPVVLDVDLFVKIRVYWQDRHVGTAKLVVSSTIPSSKHGPSSLQLFFSLQISDSSYDTLLDITFNMFKNTSGSGDTAKGNPTITLLVTSSSDDYQFSADAAASVLNTSGDALAALHVSDSRSTGVEHYEQASAATHAIAALDWDPVIRKLHIICQLMDTFAEVCQGF